MLRTRSILSPRSSADGLRVSVMSRHTLNDGVTPDSSILPSTIDLHWPFFGPNPKLIGDYLRRDLPWEAFERRYLEQLEQVSLLPHLSKLVELSRCHDITLMCIEHEPEHCHRRLLAEHCKRIDPKLEISIA